jgi:hypothetical protein
MGGVAFKHSQRTRSLQSGTTPTGARAPLVEASLHPKYPYSVIPGGVYSAGELQRAIKTDPSLREHYAGFDLRNARLVRLTEDHYGYVSYRLKNQIFWTHRRLKLPKGEVLLSDGAKYVRCRCGNRISEKAEVKIAPAEPLEAKLSPTPMTLDNLRDFDFAEAPRVTDDQPLSLQSNQLRDFDPGALQDTDSDARIKLKNPPPTTRTSPWLAALPLAALPFLAFDRGHSNVNPSNFTPPDQQGGNGGGPQFPPEPPGGGNNTPSEPLFPPVSSEPEPAELSVELLMASALIATKMCLAIRRRRALSSREGESRLRQSL